MLGNERGTDARKVLEARGDIPFALIDENNGIRGNAGTGGGQAWFGDSTRGQETYLELVPGNRVIYGWGHGPLGKTAPGVKTFDAKFDGATFTFALPDALMVRGVHHGDEMRITIELADRTRAAVDMHPIGR